MRWALRPSGVWVPAHLRTFTPPPKPRVWWRYETRGSLFPSWLLRDRRYEVVIENV